MSTLLDVCASLVIIDQNSKTLGLAHYTVQEYLLRNRIILDNEAEYLLAAGCLTFLSLDFAQLDKPTDMFQLHPFSGYPARYMDSHLKNYEESSTVDILLNFLKKPGAIQWYNELQGRYMQNIPLQLACAWGHHAAARRLLEEDPSTISVANEHGLSAIHVASAAGHEEIIDLLIANGADILDRAARGTGVLHLAVENRHARVVSLLLIQGANPLAQDADGWIPLHAALAGQDKEIVALLLENGTDYSAMAGGLSVLGSLIASGGNPAIVFCCLKRFQV